MSIQCLRCLGWFADHTVKHECIQGIIATPYSSVADNCILSIGISYDRNSNTSKISELNMNGQVFVPAEPKTPAAPSEEELPGRTLNALRRAGITKPHLLTVVQLLKVANIGVQGITVIAQRTYGKSEVEWPELTQDFFMGQGLPVCEICEDPEDCCGGKSPCHLSGEFIAAYVERDAANKALEGYEKLRELESMVSEDDLSTVVANWGGDGLVPANAFEYIKWMLHCR